MTSTAATHPWHFVRHNPLVPAAAIFLAGVALGQWSMLPTPIMLTAAIACLGGWAIAEAAFPQIPRAWFGHLLLSLAILFAGTAVWQINQRQGEETHIARFAPDDGEIPVTLRGRVVVAPVPNAGFHGNTYFTAEMMEVFTGERWIASSGLAQIKWRASAIAPALHRGDAIEMYGWLSRPIGPLNPGGVDLRAHLAADRIFAEVRVPRSSGLLVLRRSDEIPTPRLAGIRLFLRSKLLQHTANIDSDAANTMVALLLGQRDPSIDDVSRAFADAGVAHLLAISGAHIVFLAAVVWMLLRFVPMRPQRRELLAAGIVLLYVLATPCGPPVVRAAIVLFMVLLSRLMRRPPTYMNMLAAAAVVIVILRPADLLNAGFQLTFVCTAALLVLAERVHKGLFGRYLDRAALIADLANTRWARFKLRMMRVLCALITANLLGSITAAPLVLFHFQQMTMYGILTGLVAFPAVAVTMIAALMQLLLELVSRGAAGLFAPVSTGVAAFTVWLVEHLAALPGAAIALRAPPAVLIGLVYVPVVLWIGRRRLAFSRALVVNLAVGAFAVVCAWFTFTSPIGMLKLQVLSVGQGSSVVMTTPGGEVMVVNAGSRDLPEIVQSAIGPTLRTDGVRRLEGMMVTGMDAVHAKNAAEVVGRYRPRELFVPPDNGTTTFARMAVEDVVVRAKVSARAVIAGDVVSLGRLGVARVLWPAGGKAPMPTVILMMEYAGRRVLMMDPGNVAGLGLLSLSGADLRCDCVLLMGPDRGRGDEELRNLLVKAGAGAVVYSGRSPWSSVVSSPNTLNTANGCVTVTVDSTGMMAIGR